MNQPILGADGRPLRKTQEPSHYQETTNAIQRFQGYQKERNDVIRKAGNVVAESADGILLALLMALKAWRRNPRIGTIIVVGLVMTPIGLWGVGVSGVRAFFFPVPLQQNAAIHDRAGNAIGRGLSGTTEILAPATKAGMAVLEVKFRQEEAAKYGALNLNASPSGRANNSILTTGSNNTIFTSAGNGKVRVNKQGLDPAVAKSIEDFLSDK